MASERHAILAIHDGRRLVPAVEKALAAYNAGATNVRRWERSVEDTRPETFVESIGFEQTRVFVRTVLNHYYRYLNLWTQPGT